MIAGVLGVLAYILLMGAIFVVGHRRRKEIDDLVSHIRTNQCLGTFEIQMIDPPDSDLMP
jgi:hypothetical protein